MKGLLNWACALGLLILIIGCGGGGGGGTSSGSTGTISGGYHSPQVTGYLGNGSGAMIDTRNIYVGQTVQLQITARDVNNNLVVLNGSNWSTTAPNTIATVSSGGVLTGIGSSAGKVYTVSGSYNGGRYTANLVVSPQGDLVVGNVRSASSAIASVIIDFYDASGKKVAVAYSSRDGSFEASVPATSTRFTIDLSLADPSDAYYYKEFDYGTGTYVNGTSCLVKLPTPLSATAPNTLPNDIVVYVQSLGPPPPPSACFP